MHYGPSAEVYTFGLILWQLFSHSRLPRPVVLEHFIQGKMVADSRVCSLNSNTIFVLNRK